ncbi:Nuclear protein, contains WD40 repeats [Plasmopara halstedii]|uniref:Nuclear protein, contains WD40 repeats n=1 Tax=Plasmopara halstedii TaxID=4781 RepID=A0A0P1B3R2_PLAHL|nr:Nuclear protein, contains WD40 repeats [Plasmopara halstedii]CEG49122.1 Nuclear protein, contains WD40 repeats [Plasmopara halstedii]|eukprot:XP_024585491.1 Nuclear protein, contains WD40 repeats [Plasmopara halstedii]
MSVRSDSGHSRNSSTASSGLPPPPPPGSAPMPPNISAARFSLLDHVSPEVTPSNPLHQLLQHQPQLPPAPLPPYSMGGPSQFIQPFPASSSTSMPMVSSHMRSMPSMVLPSALSPQFQQNVGTFPPPRPAPLPPSFSPFQPMPGFSSTSGGMFPSASRSAAAMTIDSSRNNDFGASASSSVAGSPRRAGSATGFGAADVPTTPPGVEIFGKEVEYHSRGENVPGESRSLEVMPITLYNSERTSQLGNLISVNEHYISYPIRNGLIRVISQNSVDRLLLRKHEHHAVTELAFFDCRSELMLSSGTDHHIAIWTIKNDPMSRELIKLLPTQAQRVKWHPSDSNKIAVANGSVVFITELSGVSADGSGAQNLYDISVVCGQMSGQINDMAFSPGRGECIITAGNDGFVHVYRIQGKISGQAAEFIQRFEPFSGAAVNSLHFFGGNYMNQPGLFIGGESNTRLSLWDVPLTESTLPICNQNVKLRDETHVDSSMIYETILDPTTQFLFVADRAKPLIYVLHLAPSSDVRSARRFDNVTEFTLAYPVLSMGLLNRMGQSQPAHDRSDTNSALGGLNFIMQLYCLQTQAIQRYHVGAQECYYSGVRGSIEDEVETGENVGQTVGAVTTEGEGPFQTTAESPRATPALTIAPETEIDVRAPEENDGEEFDGSTDRHAPLNTGLLRTPTSPGARSTRSTRSAGVRSLQLATGDDVGSVGDDGQPPSLRYYNRSSPSSSVRALQDEGSVQYEPSIDDTLSETQQQSLLTSLRRMEVAQLHRDEELREQMRSILGSVGNHLTQQVSIQVEKSIQKQLQTVLVPAMGRIVLHTMENNFMKPVQNGFQHVISEKLIPLIEQKLDNSLATSLPDQLANGVDEMVQRVVEDVRQPVRESFRECFQDILIPSFQAATQKMFEQINDTFVHGTRSAFESSGQSSSNAKVANQLEQLTKVVESLSNRVEQLSSAVVTGGSNGAIVPAAKSIEEIHLEAQKNTVLDCLSRNDWEEAFKFALGAQNVKIVAFACQECDPRLVLSSRPPKLSQMLILCLVQQLGADLVDDLETKLNWLRESLLVMDVSDQTIAGFVTSVLQELQSSLNSVPAQYRDSQYTLLYHVLNSMLNLA